MLVWISKGFVDIRTDVVSIFKDDDKESLNIYGIELREGFSDDSRMIINYTHRDERDSDFQLLKDGIISLKVRNNVMMYNPPNGTTTTQSPTSGRRNSTRNEDVHVVEENLVAIRANQLRSQLNMTQPTMREGSVLFSTPDFMSASSPAMTVAEYERGINTNYIPNVNASEPSRDDDTIPF